MGEQGGTSACGLATDVQEEGPVSSECSHRPTQPLPVALSPEFPLCGTLPVTPILPSFLTQAKGLLPVAFVHLGEMASMLSSLLLPCESWEVTELAFLLGKCNRAS